MATRRRGQIIERGPNRFLLRIPRGKNGAGTRLYHNETFHGTRREAEARLVALQHQTNTGTLPTATTQTVSEFFTLWLAHRPDLTARSLHQYRYIWQRYWEPEIGHLKLQAVQPDFLQAVVGRIQEQRQFSSATMRTILPILKAGFQQAVKWRKLTYSPAEHLVLPAASRGEKVCWSPDELHAFLRQSHQSPYHALWMLLGTTGLRPGEALALTWDDLIGHDLRVTKHLSLDAQRRWIIAPATKTHSMRTVVVPETTLKVLERHRRMLARRALELGPAYARSNLMFPNPDGDQGRVGSMNIRFQHEAATLGFRVVTLHSLRHAHATELLRRGVHPKIVSERLGHSSITMTLDTYSHVLPNIQSQTVREYNEGLRLLEEGWGDVQEG